MADGGKWSLEDAEAFLKAEAEKAATNGQTPNPPPPPEPPTMGPGSTQGDDSVPGDMSAYIEAGIAKQLAFLRAARPGTERTRNTTLFVSAVALGRLEAVDRRWLRRALLDACKPIDDGGNGLIEDDGEPQCRKTIASGFRDADKKGPRDVDADYFDRINVEEVPMSTFTAEDLDDEPASSGQGSTNGLASVTPIAGAGGKADMPAPSGRQAELRAAIFAAEGDFWERDSLSAIRDAALMRMTPPWGVLAHCVARALVRVGPQVRLPALIGGKGSLNWFGIVAAPSGDGKSSAGAVAGALVLGVDDLIRNIGSGEGIAAQFRPPGRNPQNHNELMFLCEEIDTLAAMKDRTSSTTTAVLCNAFMGDVLGHSYRNSATQTTLARHEYRMTLIVGAQPGRAATLLEDVYSGMLQRFQWFPGFDPRVTRARARPGELIYPLQLPTLGHWTPNRADLSVPEPVSDEILNAREKGAQGLADALDGHLLFVREKFAQGLAVLDDRDTMTEEDWRLAGIAIDVSQATREWVTYECRMAEDEIARRKGRPMGLARSAADVAKSEGDERQLLNCARRIRSRLAKGPASRRDLQKATAMPARWFDVALQNLIAEKVVEAVIDANGRPGFALVSKPRGVPNA